MSVLANITSFTVGSTTEEITASNAFAQTAGDLPAGTEIIRVTNSGSINTAYCSASSQPYVYGHTSTPADADQLIRATILRRSSTNDADQQMSLVARARSGGGVTYGIRGCYNWDGSTAIVFLSYADSGTGGSWTTIGSSFTVTRLGADSEADLELQVYGTSPNITVKLLWAGVERISTTSFSSSDLSTNAGKVGLHIRRFAASTESTGLHFKTFYAEDGYTGGGGGSSTIAADQGTFTHTGQTANLLFGRVLAADSGTFTNTGQDVTLTKTTAYSISADYGSFSLAGQDVAFQKTDAGSYVLTAEVGLFSLVGQGALASYSMNAEIGSFVIAGQEVTFSIGVPAAYSLTADAGSYSLTGQNARLDWSGAPIVPNRQAGIYMGMRIGL